MRARRAKNFGRSAGGKHLPKKLPRSISMVPRYRFAPHQKSPHLAPPLPYSLRASHRLDRRRTTFTCASPRAAGQPRRPRATRRRTAAPSAPAPPDSRAVRTRAARTAAPSSARAARTAAPSTLRPGMRLLLDLGANAETPDGRDAAEAGHHGGRAHPWLTPRGSRANLVSRDGKAEPRKDRRLVARQPRAVGHE
ncbi:uncharacterized protein LOC125538853 [Triticum urartu]|uniref:uncharacterized protein LOC125538853 n=1 Tax=Triticum urartu TaxID=4572 RepID=UPI00204484BB|nr:uncharacterized protein LOC125538853 [Triticum urartu]